MHDEHVNVTPLIDVVMCLIIFFMLVGQLAKDEGNDKVIVPKATQTPQELAGDVSGKLVLNVVPRDRIAGQPINPGVEPEVIVRGGVHLDKMNDLTAYLRKEKRDTPNIMIVVRADQELAYDWIAPVLVACAQADIKSVHFSTKQD